MNGAADVGRCPLNTAVLSSSKKLRMPQASLFKWDLCRSLTEVALDDFDPARKWRLACRFLRFSLGVGVSFSAAALLPSYGARMKFYGQVWMSALSAVMLLDLGACTTTDTNGAAAASPPPPGVEGDFIGSCSTTLNCCAQCFEYYSSSATQAQRDQLKDGCPGYENHCSSGGLQGRCVIPVGSLVAGLTTVDFRYETTPSGGTYTSAEQSLEACVGQGGTWFPADGSAPSGGEPGGKGSGGASGGAALTGVVAVSAGSYFTCALLQDQTVACWGSLNSAKLS